MLLWLEDLNWPGAELIQERLVRFQKVDLLALYLNSWIPALDKLEKRSWLEFISPVLENQELLPLLKHDTVKILQRYRAEK